SERSAAMSARSIPILTTSLPRGFRIQEAPPEFAFLVHCSANIDGGFVRQLSVIESPQFSASASLVNASHKKLYRDLSGVVAILNGPPEHISQSYRGNLATGKAVTWK